METRVVVTDAIPAAEQAFQAIVRKATEGRADFMWHDPRWVQYASDVAWAAARFRTFVMSATESPDGFTDLTEDEIIARLLPVGWRVKDGEIWTTAEVDAAELAKTREERLSQHRQRGRPRNS